MKRWLSSSRTTGLFSCGYNEFYQLFLQDNINRNVLTLSNTISLSKDERIKQVNAGEKHSFLLTNKGKLYGIGMNEFGQVGHVATIPSSPSSTSTTSSTTSLNQLEKKSKIYQQNERITMSTLIDIDHVLNPSSPTPSSNLHQSTLNSFNSSNSFKHEEIQKSIKYLSNQLERNDFITNVSCGRDFTFISTDKGYLYACGNNLYGQLGLSMKIKYRNHFTKINLPEKVESIACGAFHTIILTRDHHIYVMGLNIFGQLGFDPKLMEQRVLNEAYINPKGELIDFSYVSKPIRLDYFDYMAYEGDFIEHVQTGACHTAFLSKSGKLFMCGFNINGEIGMGHSVRYSFTPKRPIFRYPIPYMESPTIKSMSCGLDHTVVVTESGEVFACGKNEDGQLGLGDYKNRFEFNLIEDFENTTSSKINDVKCGMSHTIFIGSDQFNSFNKQDFYVSGCNKYGNLGLGDYENRNRPTKLSGVAKSKNGILWKVFSNSHCNSTYFVQIKEKNWLQRLWDSLFLGV